MLTKVNSGLTHSIVTLQSALNSGTTESAYDEILLDVAAFTPQLPRLNEIYAESVRYTGRLEQVITELSAKRSRDAMIALRDLEQEFAEKLEKLETEIEERSRMLNKHYGELNQHITVIISIMTLLGLALFGAGVTWFFTRLASDINRLEERAVAVVTGYRGELLAVARHDEVGGLMEAINRMQSELHHREQQQEISLQQRFHQEKMAAVGSLAAAVAHEVSNPINSISGIAQYTIDTIRSHQPLDDETLCGNAEVMLEQTERIGLIMRRLADFSAPHSPDPELINVNEVVQATCSFIRYDKRFRQVDLVPDLDRDLPAVRAVADHLTQVLMNLLINAADAMDGVTGRKPAIRVSTHQADGELILSVHDNGQGIAPAILAQAFEQSFTTKPAGKGRGIGLYLCKTLIEGSGGRIKLESSPGVGTSALIRLPAQHRQAAAG
ncbi:MAG: GHKL domain-containing protein [Betaproteobacteria bacterium]|nr:GHKL domain-containing protein [Betaproteobacteria bacterium]